jgi:Ca2+-binding EF-hand superfamily protein
MPANRSFNEEDIPHLLEKIFNEFDHDKNHRFTKGEFPRVVKTLINLVGGEEPSTDDVEDIFNLLDVNGDETIDRKEFMSLLITFFRVLREKDIEVNIAKETDITDVPV